MALSEKIIDVESGGRRYAKNPRSSAYGPGQFISSTWMQMIEKYRPDLTQGRSRAEILELRSDPKISREMTDAYARENAEYLKSRGLEPTEGNTYLSHFAGPEGAAALLSNPSAPAKSVLSPAAIEANPFLAGWSSQQVIDWSSGKMGGQPKATAQSAGPTGGMLDEALTATSPKGDKGMNPLSMLLALSGGNPAALSSLTASAGGTAAAEAAPAGGSGEFMGSLSNILGGSSPSPQSSGGGQSMTASLEQANDAGIAETEKMNAQVMAALSGGGAGVNPNVDMSRLAQILQRRASLGV
jgi:hypothetical protein